MILFEDFFTAKSSEAQKRICEYLVDRDSEDQVVVFRQTGDLPGSSGQLGIAKKAKQEKFELLDGSKLQSWIQTAAKTKNVHLSAKAVRALIDRAASDLWISSAVLDQLSSYCDGREATEEDVKLFTDASLDENIFHFTDALALRDTKSALELLVDQLSSGSHPLYILTMLIRQFRIMLLASDESTNQSTVKKLKIHPYAFDRARQQSRKFSRSVLKALFQMLAEMDQSLKGDLSKDPETVLTRFVYAATKGS